MTFPQQGWPQGQPQQAPQQNFVPVGGQQYAQPQQGFQPPQGGYSGTAPMTTQNAPAVPNGPAPGAQQGFAQQAAPSFDDAEDPSAFGGLFARPRHLEGRVVVYIPKRVDNNAKGIDGSAKSTPNIHGDLLVIDGPSPLLFGDKLASGGAIERPCTHSVTVPAFFANVIVGEQEVSKALARAVPPMGNGLMVGVIVRGTKGNRPYLLQTLENDDPRRAFARQVYEAWRNKQWTPPEFVEIAPTPGSAAQQMPGAGQWSQPQSMGGQVQQWQQQPQTVASGGQMAQPAQWQQAQPFGQQQPAQQAQPTDLGQGGFGSEQWRQPAPGWDANQWQMLSDVNKQQVWATVPQSGQQAQQQPANMAQPTGF